jgi:lipopolysaccharide biosynthesis glycosyltransferase
MKIHLLSTINEHYTSPFRVTVQSMLDQVPDQQEIHWHILHPGMPGEAMAAVEALSQDDRINFKWYEISEDSLAAFPVRGHFVPHVYSRILAPEILPAEVERFLYLDADLLVLDDVSALWKTPLEGKILAAVPDMAVPVVSAPMGLKRHEALGIAADAPYFNAGVYLADVQAWKDASVTLRAIEYLERYRSDVNLLDQDALNAVLHDRWKRLDVRWNLIASLANRQHYRPDGIDLEEYRNALQHPAIVHYAGLLKPWNQSGIASFEAARYKDTLLKVQPRHEWDRSWLSRGMGFYDRRLRSIFYPVEKQIWHMRKGF